jgi:hypothetical protein
MAVLAGEGSMQHDVADLPSVRPDPHRGSDRVRGAGPFDLP